MQITVRKATAADYAPLCELFNEVDALHRDHLPGIFQVPAGASLEQDRYQALITDENAALLVAEDGGQLLGYVHVVLRDAPAMPVFVPRRYAVVEAVVVRSASRKQGIGKRLMHEAQAWAAANGVGSIELNVYEFNRSAIAFYEQLGYQTLSRKLSRQLNTHKGGG